jgi:hypothetical protein
MERAFTFEQKFRTQIRRPIGLCSLRKRNTCHVEISRVKRNIFLTNLFFQAFRSEPGTIGDNLKIV